MDKQWAWVILRIKERSEIMNCKKKSIWILEDCTLDKSINPHRHVRVSESKLNQQLDPWDKMCLKVKTHYDCETDSSSGESALASYPQNIYKSKSKIT